MIEIPQELLGAIEGKWSPAGYTWELRDLARALIAENERLQAEIERLKGDD